MKQRETERLWPILLLEPATIMRVTALTTLNKSAARPIDNTTITGMIRDHTHMRTQR